MEKRYLALLRGVNISGKNKVPMAELRQAADALEQMCPAHLWTMPTYGELLYGV